MGWKTFNDRLAIISLIAIAALWTLDGLGTIMLKEALIGFTIAQATLILQYYFRRQPPNGGGV